MRVCRRLSPWKLSLLAAPLCAPLGAAASEAYLCAQLDRIRAEENMPAIGAGLILPDANFPQYSAQQFIRLYCASGVEIYGSPTKVTGSTQFPIGSITKPITGLIIARVIADEASKPNPKLTWNTRLVDFFPHIATLKGANRCYDRRTVADLMSHSTGMPNVPTGEPGDQFASVEANVVARRALYVDAAVKDTPVVNCFDSKGNPLPQLPERYAGGVIIAAHMAEVVTGRSWEDLVRSPGPTTVSPGLAVGSMPDPSYAPFPYAYGHQFGFDGVPVVTDTPVPSSTNAPAGSIMPTLPQLAGFLTHFLDATADDWNRQLPDAERAGLFTQHGLSGRNRLGWSVITLNSSAFSTANVGHWVQPDALHHNGLTGSMYADAYLAPTENAAMFSTVTADGPWIAGNNSPQLPNRNNTQRKVFAELTALRLHQGLAADIVHNRKPATVAVNGASSQDINKLADGRLTTKWSATTVSPLTITLSYQEPTTINRVVIAEDAGQNITRYELSYQDSSNAWHVLADNVANQDLIFPHRIFETLVAPPPLELFASPSPISAKKLRLRVLSASAPPQLVEFAGAYLANIDPTRNVPFWFRKGFAEALPNPVPVLRNDYVFEPAPDMNIIRTFDPGFMLKSAPAIRTEIEAGKVIGR